jgi:outer membrane protein assembly factor BamB/tetratricopeptide (TPR) repeat protein
MALKGDLASVDLAQVFQMLALNKKVGLLSILSQRTWNVLYFDQRGVTSYYNSHQVMERVVAACTRSGRLDVQVVDETRDHAARVGLSLVECLLAGGYLSTEELENLIRGELEEEIYDLFFCKDAKFEFLEGLDRLDTREGLVDERFFFNTDSVIMEAARRIDEWSYICERIPNSLEVYRPVAAPQDSSRETAAVFELIDGRRNVGRVIEVSGLGNFQVFKHLCQLLDAGCIAALPPEEFIDAGDACMREGRLPDAINLYEKSVALGVGVPDVHSKAAEAYQAAQEYENALYHLKCEAEYRLAAGDHLGAAARLHSATRLVPTDLAARERLVELTLGNAGLAIDGHDPVAAGKALVELYLEVGDHPRMRNMLERLLRVQPDDLDLKKLLVNLHTKAGDHKRVVELYESIADDLVRLDRPLEAVGYLQKILMLDRSRHDVSEKLRQLYVFDESARRRRRMLAFLATVAALLVAVAFVYRRYDRLASEAFEQLDLQTLIAAEQFTEATAVCESFAASHPFTRVLGRLREESLRIDALRRKHEATIAAAQVAAEQELEQIRAEYRAEWRRHEDLFKDSKPEAALAAVERVRKLVKTAGGADDAAWALQQQVEKTAIKLQDYLDTAARLAREAEQRFAAGEWEAARAAALRVLKDFDLTSVARKVLLPVRLASRPAGAAVLRGGRPLLGPDQQPAQTPVVVLVEPGIPAEFTIELAGFSAESVAFDPKTTASKEVVLRVLAAHTIRMPGRLQTGIGVGGGWVAGGLLGGKLGVARTDTGASQEIQLGGLKQVDSTPVVHGGNAYFLSNEQTIECIQLERGTSPAGWPVAIGNPPLTDLTVREGRVSLVDQQDNLLCWDLVDGRRLWSLHLEGSPSGAPQIERRTVRVATAAGRVLLVDAADGRVRELFRSPVGITTRILAEGGVLYFGAADGTIRAVAETDGKVLWSAAAGRTIGDGEFTLSAAHVIVLGGAGRLLALRREDGQPGGEAQLTGTPLRGPRICGKRVFVGSQVPKDKDRAAYDLIQAFDLDRVNLLWEYVSHGALVAEPSADDRCVYVPQVTGEIVLFR